MKEARITTFFLDQASFTEGALDVHQRLADRHGLEKIDYIENVLQSATEAGLYLTVVWQEKKEKKKAVLGYGG